jgi:hypothetical protein
MRNVSDESYTENQKMFYVQQPFSEIRAVCEIMWKMWWSQTGHRWQFNQRLLLHAG